MTLERMRVKIAEACGWKLSTDCLTWFSPSGSSNARQTDADRIIPDSDILPDYCNDLNAMHEAEKVLTQEQRQEYFYQLNAAVGLVDPFSPAWIKEFAVVSIAHATAMQRAEAFLHTLGLWEEKEDNAR